MGITVSAHFKHQNELKHAEIAFSRMAAQNSTLPRMMHFFRFKMNGKIFRLTKSTKNMLKFCGLLRAIISILTSKNVD